MENFMEKALALNFSENELKKRGGNNYLLKTCPFCGRTWKMNINLDKQCFRCPACDESGNAAKLHAKINNIRISKARIELEMKDVDKNHMIVFKNDEDQIDIVDDYMRSLIYLRMIRFGSLNQEHIDNLHRRGLDDLSMYVSCSSLPKVENIYKNVHNLFLYKENGNEVVKGIPGLYGEIHFHKDADCESYEDIHINVPNDGFLIPVINHSNGSRRISCFQIRKDRGDVRYIYLSSIGKVNGIGVEKCKKVHYTSNFWGKDATCFDKVPETIYLTEGALKADVAAHLSGNHFIAIPGVNAYRDLEDELVFLKNHGCKTIALCFDMDYKTNPNVKNAMKKVIKMISDEGLKVKRIEWDGAKGIDDFLLMQKTKER